MTLLQVSEGVQLQNYIRPAKANVFIGDVSGSMSGVIRRLADDIMARIDKLPQGDALLMGIFSGQGWYRWIIARELQEPADYEKCKAIVKEELYVRGTTCFSEILQDCPKALNPLLAKFPVVTLTLYSDGVPVVPSLQKEDQAIAVAAQALAPLLTSSTILGYGDYADRARLSRLAQLLGGEFVATDHFEEIGGTFERASRKRSTRKKRVHLPQRTDVAFAVTPDGSVSLLNSEEKSVDVDEQASVFAWAKQFQKNDLSVPLGVDIHYAAALALLTNGRVDDAVSHLSQMGDVALVNALGSALTNAEFVQVETALRDAIVDEKKRFVGGKKIHCLPAEDAFDLLACLDLLAEKKCLFHPYHPQFSYKRIGRASETKPGYAKFRAEETIGVPFGSLTGHESELNLSVKATIPGTIELPDEVTDENGTVLNREVLGLPKQFQTYVFRNYSLIANALPSTTKIPVTITDGEAIQRLSDALVLGDPDQNNIYLLDLSRIPICNRKRGKLSANWQEMADLALLSLQKGSVLKVLKAKREELDPKRESEQSLVYTEEQTRFLMLCGVDRRGGYAPPTIQEEATDVLDVRSLEVGIKSGSPVTMKDFGLMVAKTKKLNMVGSFMMVGYDLIQSSMPQKKGEALVWLTAQIEQIAQEKRAIDAKLNAMRFAAALTGAWVKSFKEPTATFTVGKNDEYTATIKCGTIRKTI